MSDLDIFSNFVEQRSAREITPKDIDRFVKAQSEQGLKASTINRRLSTLSSFFEYLLAVSDDDRWKNPVHWKRHGIQPGKHLPRDVSDGNIAALLEVIQDTRDRAIVMLMVGAGLRIGEVVSLQLDDFDPDSTTQLVRLHVRGKGDKERAVWLTGEVFQHVQNWLIERPETASKYLFLNQHGRPLSVAGIQYRLKEHCRKAEVRFTAHQLRHTFARRLVENQMPVESLAKLLGHSDLRTTQRYIDGADPALRSDFLQTMQRIDQITGTEHQPQQPGNYPRSTTVSPRDTRPDPVVLLDQMIHLSADLPDWLVLLLREHVIRRSVRWSAHRVRSNLQNSFTRLCMICRWLVKDRDWQQIDQLQRSDLIAYVNARQEAGLNPNSIRTELVAFRSLWRDWLTEERVTNGTLLQVKAPEQGDPLPRFLTLAEYQRLEQIMKAETAADQPQDKFDQAWFYLLAHTGLRLSELLNLRVDDCDLVGQRLRVCSGKDNRDRVIPMTRQLATIIQEYLAVREPISSNHLLVTDQKPLNNNRVVRRLRRWGRKAQIMPMTPHRLRHTLATLLINQGMPVVSLRKLLGHQDINNTMIYARVHDDTVKRQFTAAMDHIERIPISDWPSQLVQSAGIYEELMFDSV